MCSTNTRLLISVISKELPWLQSSVTKVNDPIRTRQVDFRVLVNSDLSVTRSKQEERRRYTFDRRHSCTCTCFSTVIVTNSLAPLCAHLSREGRAARAVKMGNSGYWLVVVFMSLCDRTFSSEYIPADQQTPAFKDYERFLDIFPLTEDNFTASVMKNPDPWVVLFHNGVLDREWKSMAVSLRGIVWVGMIDLQQSEELLSKIGYDAKADRPARVYKYGTQKSKQSSWQSVTDATTARAKSVSSIPDVVLPITVNDFEDFLIESYASRPSRFPALFLTEEKDSSAVMKAIASRFKKYFNFGKMVAPSHDDLNKLGLDVFADQMPTIVVLLVKGESLQFNAVPFDKNKMGDFNYPNILAYMFSINQEFRHQLPGENQADRREVMEMDDIVEVESRRFDVKGLNKPGTSKTVKYETLSEAELDNLHDEL